MAVKQSLQCIVEPGEAIFIPTNWRHATCNLSPLTLSLGGQGDLGVFPDRELIDAILDDDQPTASRLLHPPWRRASLQRQRMDDQACTFAAMQQPPAPLCSRRACASFPLLGA